MDKSTISALRAEWEENGCVKIPNLLDAETLAHCRRCFDETRANPRVKPHVDKNGVVRGASTYPEGSFYNLTTGYVGPRELYQELLAARPVFAKTVAEIWGSKSVWFFGDELFHKVYEEGGPQKETPFHQDTAYFPCHGEHMANLWIPFDDLPKENSLEMVPKSHRGPLYNFDNLSIDKDYTKGQAPGNPRLAASKFLREDWELRSWATKKGDVIMLHPHMIHGGGPVGPALPERNAIVLRFFGDRCLFRKLFRDLGKESKDAKGRSEGDIWANHEGLKDGDHLSKAEGYMHCFGPEPPPPQGGGDAGGSSARL